MTTRIEDDVRIIELSGELNSITSEQIYDDITPLINKGDRILLDLTNVSFMTSAGIRTLLLLYRRVNDNDGRVVLVGLNEQLEDTLSITGFLEFFTTQPTIDGGLRALA